MVSNWMHIIKEVFEMKRKLIIIITLCTFLFLTNIDVFAKGVSSSSSKSSSSRSSGYSAGSSSKRSGSTSSGYSAGSTSKSSGSTTGSTGTTSSTGGSGYSAGSTSKSSGSSAGSSSVSGSGKSSSSSGYTAGAASSSSVAKPIGKQTPQSDKSAYLNTVYAKETSKNNYAAYQQKMNPTQQASYSQYNTAPSVQNVQSYSTLSSSRPTRINVYNSSPVYCGYNTSLYPGGLSYGSAYCGRWDLWFLTRASDVFWYNHLDEIMMYNNMFDRNQYEQRLARVRAMNNVARDPNYLDPDVNYDLQYSPNYQKEHLNELYTVALPWYTSGWFKFLLVITVLAMIIIGIAKRWNKSAIIGLIVLEVALLLWIFALLALSIGILLVKLTIFVAIVFFIIWIISLFSGGRGGRDDGYNEVNIYN